MAGRIFLANVGANAAHRVKSPVFDDRTFEFIPIPEDRDFPGTTVVRYGDLTSFNYPGESLRRFIPKRLWSWPCHADPEFQTFTYGDECDTTPRASSLKSMSSGDYLFFIARLVRWSEGRFTGPAGFYLIGFLEIENILPSVNVSPSEDVLSIFGNNAHIRRALAAPPFFNSFWVFKGSQYSRRFKKAVPVTKELASEVFRAADGSTWRWDTNRTALQTIGSYTRSCRCVIDLQTRADVRRAKRLWQAVEAMDHDQRIQHSWYSDTLLST